jgi:mono/diheme cytochrome c family protein
MNRRRKQLLFGLALLALLLLGAVAASQFRMSALEAPGPLETRAATAAKRWLVSRAAAREVTKPPAELAALAPIGQMLYRAHCAGCHGLEGREPADAGRWMYPRAADLGSPDVQRYSDAELFWVIGNGIRFTGMPGYARILDEDEIWPLVAYVRALALPYGAEGNSESPVSAGVSDD